MKIIEKLEDGKLLLRVEKSIYRHDAILSSAYKFTDDCYIHVDSIDSNYYGVYFAPKDSTVDLISLVNNFCNELIDEQIRFSLDISNKSIKELIIRKAFFPFQDHEE
ncbi:MAG: His-Xaa-Ser system protein HxsD [Nitrospirota bacterium]